MMDEIPEDVREAAAKVVVGLGIGGSSEKSVDGFSVRDAIVRAIMAERERCANIAEEHQVATAGKPSDYTNGFNSAALIIATAIRTPSP